MGTREQNKERTRTTLADVAIQMFTELGDDDLVMAHPTAWIAVFDESITTIDRSVTGSESRLTRSRRTSNQTQNQ
jgi:hypothetical protein